MGRHGKRRRDGRFPWPAGSGRSFTGPSVLPPFSRTGEGCAWSCRPGHRAGPPAGDPRGGGVYASGPPAGGRSEASSRGTGCSTRASTRVAMKRAVRTTDPLRVTSLTSTTPRRTAVSTRRPALEATTSYVLVVSPASTTISTRSPFIDPIPFCDGPLRSRTGHGTWITGSLTTRRSSHRALTIDAPTRARPLSAPRAGYVSCASSGGPAAGMGRRWR